MRQFVARLAFTLFLGLPLSSAAQVPLIRNEGWAVKAGADCWVPLIGRYYDISVISGTDYYWDMVVEPMGTAGAYAGFSKIKAMYKGNNQGFVGWGFGYRENKRRMAYSGWEGGGTSGKYVHGTGEKIFREHVLVAELKTTHQFSVGVKNRTFLNSLGASAGFAFFTDERKSFNGYTQYSNGTSIDNNAGYHIASWNDRFYVPHLKLNYELGYVFQFEKILLAPFMETPILNLNSFLEKPNINRDPLDLRKEYYKEVAFGVTILFAESYK